MTEVEWLACEDPEQMLEFLRDKASDRKLRLFAVACCRRIWHKMTDERTRTAVTIAEQFAEGIVQPDILSAAQAEAHAAGDEDGEELDDCITYAAFLAADRDSYRAIEAGFQALMAAYNSASFGVGANGMTFGQNAETEEKKKQALHLRDIFGNPLRPVTLDPSWLTSTVSTLARAIYTDRTFDRMPILADALEESGCTNQDILSHCRGFAEHARGCWVVDLLLAKE